MKRSLAAAVLLAAGMVTPLAGCQGGQHCDAHDSITLKAGVIVGTATATCDLAPAAHRMTVYLLYRPGAATAPPRGTMTSKTTTGIPVPGRSVSVQARHTCLPGTWWVQVLVHGTGADGVAFSASDTTRLGTVSTGDCHRR